MKIKSNNNKKKSTTNKKKSTTITIATNGNTTTTSNNNTNNKIKKILYNICLSIISISLILIFPILFTRMFIGNYYMELINNNTQIEKNIQKEIDELNKLTCKPELIINNVDDFVQNEVEFYPNQIYSTTECPFDSCCVEGKRCVSKRYQQKTLSLILKNCTTFDVIILDDLECQCE